MWIHIQRIIVGFQGKEINFQHNFFFYFSLKIMGLFINNLFVFIDMPGQQQVAITVFLMWVGNLQQ